MKSLLRTLVAISVPVAFFAAVVPAHAAPDRVALTGDAVPSLGSATGQVADTQRLSLAISLAHAILPASGRSSTRSAIHGPHSTVTI